MAGSNYILVVDDDIDLAETIAAVLSADGHEVTIAANGREALDEVEKRMPSLIILDLQMPVMNGREFAHELTTHHTPHAPIIIVTAADRASEHAAGIEAIEVLTKPFDVRHLLALARRVSPDRDPRDEVSLR
jgi:DNA-binding response OmpR family regulator